MEYVLTKTTTEKLQDIFFKKCSGFCEVNKRTGSPPLTYCNGLQSWVDYLNKLEGAEYICQFSKMAPIIDYLIESINENSARRIVIKDKGGIEFFSREAFILLEPEVAEKILTLGYLP